MKMEALDPDSRTTRYSKGRKGNPADSFGTFLGPDIKREPTADPVNSPPQYSKDMLKLLFMLAQSGAHPISELMAKSGLSYYDFLQAFEEMRKQNLVVLEGAAGSEVVNLTPVGQQLVQPGP